MEAATQASASTVMQVAPETGEEALAPSSVPDVSVGVAPARRAPTAQVLAITGARGGLGASVLLLHLAWALGRAGRRVAMMDLDPTGGLDLLCGQAVLTGLRWADLPVEESAFRPGHLVGALPVWHAMPVLTGDVRGGPLPCAAAVLEAMRAEHDVVLVDLPRGAPPPPGEAPGRPLASVAEWARLLAAEPALAGVGVTSLTGRMSPADKEAAMRAFASGRCPLMVSTTVVEVGVDVPEATMMVVLDADRFGLSQLHQLRGRVGRGSRPSVCMAVTGAEVDSTAFHRLKAFAGTTDGFALAEADLELRSEGNVLGAAQSGRRSDLDLLRVTRDADLIERVRSQAEAIVAADPGLEDHPALAAAITQRLDEENQAYLERS